MRQYPSVLTTPVHTTMDMWRFLTDGSNNNNNNDNDKNDNNNHDNNSSDNKHHNNMSGGIIRIIDGGVGSVNKGFKGKGRQLGLDLSPEEARAFQSNPTAPPSQMSQSMCLGLSPEEARTFVRQGNLGYLKVAADGVRGILSDILTLLSIIAYPNLTLSHSTLPICIPSYVLLRWLPMVCGGF